jgi:hypothetical protein
MKTNTLLIDPTLDAPDFSTGVEFTDDGEYPTRVVLYRNGEHFLSLPAEPDSAALDEQVKLFERFAAAGNA